ncbi:hypothetical protein [Polyangium spumosum]|uniref:hypothetical protein n=1 Tax=Polyangium spumosum TaxID=889282 RepID=UPI00129B7488|nr:hypothetical protein [Polyangium spumosum]
MPLRRAPRGSSGRPTPIEPPDEAELRALVERVKDKVLHAEEFAEVMDAFFDHLGTDLDFLARGVPTREAALEGALAQMAAQMAGRELELLEMRLLRLPEFQMAHGLLFFAGLLGVVLIFEDIGMGVLALGEAEMRGPTMYGRFKFVALERPQGLPN